MPALTDYLSRRGEFLVLALVVALSVGLMLLSDRKRDAMARALGDASLAPVQMVVSRSLDVRNVRAENDSLRAQLARAELSLGELRLRDAQTEPLRAMLDLRDRTGWELIPARIVGREAARARVEYRIDKGWADGVDSSAVMTPKGLVGRVSRIGKHTAWVRPIITQGCQVSARIERTRTEAILGWSRQAGTHLQHVPFRAEVTAGDVVVSSGLGGVFPPGIRLGEVTRSEPQPSRGVLSVFVTPAVDFSSLEAVFVVKEASGPLFEEEEPLPDGAAAAPGGGQ
ncbi:rod shape-determining protein MreC [bacterium]|nr:rod shape-determining protein MreC [bacterium]